MKINGVTLSSGGGVHIPLPPISGFSYSAITIIGSTVLNASQQFNGILQLFTFFPINTLTVDQMQFEITTAAASTLSKLVIYSNQNSTPKNKLYESTDISSATTGLKTISTSFIFTGGTVYWLGVVSNSNSVSIRTIPQANSQPIFTMSDSFASSYNGWAISAAYGSLPSTVTVNSGNLSGYGAPFIRFRQA